MGAERALEKIIKIGMEYADLQATKYRGVVRHLPIGGYRYSIYYKDDVSMTHIVSNRRYDDPEECRLDMKNLISQLEAKDNE